MVRGTWPAVSAGEVVSELFRRRVGEAAVLAGAVGTAACGRTPGSELWQLNSRY